MSGGPDDPGKPTQKPAQAVPPRHDRTGGPTTGRMVDHENYAWKQIKANQAERQADKQRHDRAAPNSELTRPDQQPERKKLRTFEDRHPPAQTLADMKREQSGGANPQQAQRGENQPDAEKRRGPSGPNHYKTLKTFEDRHPGGNDGRNR